MHAGLRIPSFKLRVVMVVALWAMNILSHGQTGPATLTSASQTFVTAAIQRTKVNVVYDGRYQEMNYPLGDVAKDVGVCTDLIIRAYRSINIDLQRLVHKDMRAAFRAYPNIWGLKTTDTNIDHRRVPNLETFFRRHGTALPTAESARYLPGDIVSWRLPNGAPHIGIVANTYSADEQRPLIIHNIGRGPEIEDMLFAYSITGHFRYFPVR